MKFLISLAVAAFISLVSATQQSSGGMEAIQQMLQQIMGYYQQQMQMMQQPPISQMNNQQQQIGGMNPQVNNPLAMNPQASTMNPQPMNPPVINPLMNPQQQQQSPMYQLPNAQQQPQIQNNMDPNQLQQQMVQQPMMQPNPPVASNDDNYQRLLRFMQGLNNFSHGLTSNQMLNPAASNNSSVSVFPVTPAVGPVVTVTQTIQPTVKQRFADALLDYLRAHANELQGDIGAFLKRIIARHDARMEQLKSKVCTPTSTNNDWNEQNPTPPAQAVVSPSPQQNIAITPTPQIPQQSPIWGVTSTSQVWSTSFSF